MVLTSPQTSIRKMLPDDLACVLQIERNSQIVPWSRLAFEEALTRCESRQVEQTACYINRVISIKQKSGAGQTDRLAGFYILSTVVDELHILNLAVASDYRSKGLGHLILKDIICFASLKKCKKIFLKVRKSNKKAINLYEKWNFSLLHVRGDYYRTQTDDKEDAWVMVRHC